jgi:hypothetical protein
MKAKNRRIKVTPPKATPLKEEFKEALLISANKFQLLRHSQ